MRRANRLAIKPLVLLGTLLFAAALLGGQPVQGQTPAELDRAALEALYDSTGGANWTTSTNWKIDDDLGAWHGVIVTSDGRVTELHLNNNNLVGPLPNALGNLTALVDLRLHENQLTGEIPSLSGLTSLVNAYMQRNQLSGSIPSLRGLTELQALWLQHNQLTGEFPVVTGATNLYDVDFSSNRLTGEIPNLSVHTALSYLYLADNQLTGEIPDLTTLTALSELNLSQNKLTGMVPASLGKLDNVVSVVLYDNQLTGPIPDELSTPPKKGSLITLNLSQNQLTGKIPESLGDHTNLQTLYLWGNRLTGDIPDLSGLTKVVYLSLSRNQLTGAIPASLGGLSSVVELYLNNNRLTGDIPDLSGLTSVAYLYLHTNQLTGQIPDSLDNLPALYDLRLSHNQLTGEVPDSLGGTSVRYLYLNNNKLTAQIPDLSNLYLLELDLSTNQLTGEIPATLAQIIDLEVLLLDDNQLTGEIPAALGNLNLLTRTRFANNALTGCVPHAFPFRTLLTAAEVRPGVPAQDFIAVDANGDGDTDDAGDVPGLNLPFCTLSTLTLSEATLAPTFAPGTTTYTAESTGTSTMVTVTQNESSDRLSIGKGATSYSAGDPIPLEVGSNLITIEVTPTDSRLLKQTYTVDVFRAGSAQTDREALIALYNSAGGSGWTASVGWDTTQALGMWHGVTVTGGRVVGLALAGNNLSGTVPASLSTLTKLTSLDLSYNGLSGAIPPGLRGLSQLTTLDLSANGLSGAIPPELGDLSSLDELYLHDNELSGAIPPELGNLSSLDALYLHGNELSGAIPPELGNLSSLEELSLWDNGLSGPIPGSLGNLLALRFARFADNLLTGCVPHGLRYLVAAADFLTDVPAHDFARDTNRDGDTEDAGDIAGLVLPFCGLSQLTLGGLTLDPAFDDGTVAYIASAGHSVTSTTVTATLNGSSDRVSIRKGTTYMSGDAVPLAVGVNVITIAVTASDGTTAPHTYVVTVTRAPNMPPVFDEGSTAARGVDENTAANQPIGDPLTATDADNDTLTYSLDTTSDAFFDIDSGGQLLTEAGLDREARNSYSVNVSVSDGKASDGTASDGTDSTITVTITIADVNEPPVVARRSGMGAFSIVENSGTDVGAFEATDPEGQGVTWSLATTGDHGRFEIDAANGALSFRELPDYESSDLGLDKAYTVTVQATEQDGGDPLTGDLDVTVTITNVNEPADISFAASGDVTVTDNALSVDENYDGTLATFSASDPEREAGLTYEWSVGGTDRLDFAVTGGGGVLSFAAIPDYELPADSGRNNVYDITVNALGSDGKTGSIAVTVTVGRVDEPADISFAASGGVTVTDNALSVDENYDDTLATFSASDPERKAGLTYEWSVGGTDGSDFVISEFRVLSFAAIPDYELPADSGGNNVYDITVNALDSDGKTGSIAVTVTVGRVDEPADISFAASGGVTVTDNALSVDENYDDTLATFSASDPERKAGLTYEWSVGGTDGSDFVISEFRVLSFAAIPDYELPADSGGNNVYDITVNALDSDGKTGSIAVTVTVGPENERPVVRRRSGTGPFSIVENSGTDVGSFVATDPEGQVVTWSLATSGDHGRFEIDAANGALSFKEAPDYESSDLGSDKAYNVTVQATEVDGGNPLTGILAVTVAVTDVNERPVVKRRIGMGAFSIEENSGRDVGSFDATDPEGRGVTWSVAGSDSGRFEIDEANGALSFKELPDFESDDLGLDKAYTVTVRATEVDDGDTQTLELTGRLDVTVAITNVNEPPTVTGNATPSVDENTTAVATYSATDPEEVAPSWSLQGGAGVFMITSAGALAFTTAPNYEVKSSYTVTVLASDGVNTTNHPVTVAVTDVDEDEVLLFSARRPLIGADYTAAFEDGTGDDVQSPMWAWERSPNGTSSWDDITGATAATYRPVGADRDHYLRVTVSYDDGHPAKTLQATSELPTLPDIPNNMPPVFPSPLFMGGATGLSVDENATAGTVVGLAPQATDPEVGTLDYSLAVSGVVTPPFEINDTSRQIRVAGGAALDHEDQDRYSVTVTAEDEYNATGTATFDITIEDVNERPVAVFDIPLATDEDTATTFAVLANDIDQDDGDTLTVSITSQPSRGRVVADTTTQLLTYTPAENDHGTYTFMYTASDGTLSSLPALVTVTVNPVNDAPAFPAAPAERTVSENARPGDDVGAVLTATDVDGDTLTYGLTGAAASDFEIDEQTGQITVATGAALNAALSPYIVTVTADDGSGEANATATVEVTITVTARPVVIITGGGGGGGGGGGPSPSEVDFEWTVQHDIAELDGGNDWPTGLWSDGETLWIAENGQGTDDAVYAYDLASGERVEEREFDLAEANRAPRGIWSDRSVVWVSDSGRERLFAYDLATGERLEEREFALAERNADARGIWSDEETMWVLDSRAGALFAYGFESGELLAEYELDSANDDPRGIWSDGVTIWVSDHGAKRLIAYRLPVLPDAETDPGEEDADDDARELERVSDEEFTELSKASNNSPRGIWSDGDVMYVADESDDRVYTYNMPDAIDARLASLTLSGVDIGEFDPGRTDYEAVVADGVTEATVEAAAIQRRAAVVTDPPDADGDDANGHQVALEDLGEITVTVTSQDGSRTRVYRVQFPETAWDPARDPWPHCLRGAISEGFSLVVHEGGSVEELIGCAESRGIVALYALHEGVYVSHILGAPDFVNAGFVELFPDGLPPIAPLIAGSNGPPSADPFADLDDGGQQPWPECLRGDIAAGFSLVVHEGGSVDELEACAQSRDVAALYALSDGEFVSYILGAPDFVTRAFRDLFADGVPPMTPLVARSEGPPGGR